MIEVKNVTKKYGNFVAVDNISFEVKDHEIVGFLGPNGAGKSTTMNMITGFIEPTDGKIVVNGYDISSSPLKAKKQIGYVPDNPELYENMKAIDYINFICDMYDVDKETRERNIKKYAKLFEMEDKLGDTIDSYSHGMKQKIVLISALAHDPKILIMDEPFVGLDPKAVFDIKEVLNEMIKEGKTVFYSTHILDVAEKLCDRVAIIKGGKLVKSGSMKEIKGDKSLEKVFMELEK